jgi:hypothetical protein
MEGRKWRKKDQILDRGLHDDVSPRSRKAASSGGDEVQHISPNPAKTTMIEITGS